METTLPPNDLLSYYRHLVDREFPDRTRAPHDLDRALSAALERVEHAFARIAIPGYRSTSGAARFSHLHGDQSAAFFYFAANSAWRDFDDDETATIFFLLNKRHNGLVCMYDTQLPDVFVLVHTVGTVLGKATYGNYLAVYQNVTVGTSNGRQPAIGDNVILYGGSMILGACVLGAGVTVGAGTTLIDRAVPGDSVVANNDGKPTFRARKRDHGSDHWVAVP